MLAEVLRTRSSASLYLPFAAMNVVNGLLWTTYGLALGDSFIYGPNLVRLQDSVCTHVCNCWARGLSDDKQVSVCMVSSILVSLRCAYSTAASPAAGEF